MNESEGMNERSSRAPSSLALRVDDVSSVAGGVDEDAVVVAVVVVAVLAGLLLSGQWLRAPALLQLLLLASQALGRQQSPVRRWRETGQHCQPYYHYHCLSRSQ